MTDQFLNYVLVTLWSMLALTKHDSGNTLLPFYSWKLGMSSLARFWLISVADSCTGVWLIRSWCNLLKNRICLFDWAWQWPYKSLNWVIDDFTYKRHHQAVAWMWTLQQIWTEVWISSFFFFIEFQHYNMLGMIWFILAGFYTFISFCCLGLQQLIDRWNLMMKTVEVCCSWLKNSY